MSTRAEYPRLDLHKSKCVNETKAKKLGGVDFDCQEGWEGLCVCVSVLKQVLTGEYFWRGKNILWRIWKRMKRRQVLKRRKHATVISQLNNMTWWRVEKNTCPSLVPTNVWSSHIYLRTFWRGTTGGTATSFGRSASLTRQGAWAKTTISSPSQSGSGSAWARRSPKSSYSSSSQVKMIELLYF